MQKAWIFLPAFLVIAFAFWTSTWNDPEPETWQERQARIEREEKAEEFLQRGYRLEIEFMERTRDEQIEFMTLERMGAGFSERDARNNAIAEFNDELYFLYLMTDQGHLVPDESEEFLP